MTKIKSYEVEFLKKVVLSVVALLFLVVSVACSGQSAAETENTKGSDEPTGKYDPPITLTMAFPETNNTTFPEGDSLDNNIWSRTLEEEYGIKIDHSWVTHSSEYVEKLNISIASGELPDVFEVTPTQFRELAEAGALADLSEVYEEHITPLADQKLNEDGGVGLEMATVDGKLMGLPYVTAAMDGATMIWIRKDWLETLGLEEPKSMEDVISIAYAFKNDDPDQNGKDDTIGLGVTGSIFAGAGGLKGYFNGFHANTDVWIEDSSSSGLVNGLIQPEMKDALARMQEMYRDGVIDQEFTTKTGIGEDVIAGKIGMFFGTMSQPLNPLQQTMDKDPNADWQFYQIQSVDGEVARPEISPNPPVYFVMNKDSKNPAAMIKMMNLWVEKNYGETADYAYQYDQGHSSHKYYMVRTYGARKNLDAHLKIKEVTETGNVDELNPEEKGYYDDIEKYKNGDQASWRYHKIFGTEGSMSLVNKYVTEDLLYPDQYQGLPTELMVQKGGILNSLAVETFTKIIMGDPIDNFDKFVDEWKTLGGDEITEEVNEWYENSK